MKRPTVKEKELRLMAKNVSELKDVIKKWYNYADQLLSYRYSNYFSQLYQNKKNEITKHHRYILTTRLEQYIPPIFVWVYKISCNIYDNFKIIDKNKEIYNEYFIDDKAGKLYLYAEDDFYYPLAQNEEDKLRIEYSVKLENAQIGDVVGEIKVFFENNLIKTIKLATMNKIDKLIESETLEISEILWTDHLNND